MQDGQSSLPQSAGLEFPLCNVSSSIVHGVLHADKAKKLKTLDLHLYMYKALLIIVIVNSYNKITTVILSFVFLRCRESLLIKLPVSSSQSLLWEEFKQDNSNHKA